MINLQKIFSTNSYVYVLRSKNDSGIYIGSTRNFPSWLKSHHYGKVKSTKGRKPLDLIYVEDFESYTEARKQAIYLKSRCRYYEVDN